jgi:hypothetical protein
MICKSALLLASVLLLASTATAATFNLSQVADAFVTSAQPNSNYGGAGSLAVSAVGKPQGTFQSLLKFDLAAALTNFDGLFGSGNWTLQGVSLQLTATSPGNPLFNAAAAGSVAVSWLSDDSWIEGSGTPTLPSATGVTFNSLPAVVALGSQSMGSFAFGGGTSGTANYLLNPSSGLRNDAFAGSLASILLNAGDSSVAALFNSLSFGNVALRPVLILSASEVPEPASVVLMGFAMLVCVVRRLEYR